jgi:ABC-type multidrug transport system fused ATPase/permease subunit
MYFSYVGQEPVLFKGSITDNIMRGRADADVDPVLSLEEAFVLAEKETHRDNKALACLPEPFRRLFIRSYREAQQTPQGSEELRDIEMAGASQQNQSVIDAAVASNAHEFITAFTQVTCLHCMY